MPATRRPRLQVLVNSRRASHVVYAHIVSTNYYSADHFSIELAIGQDAALDLAFWSSMDDAVVEIQAGFGEVPEFVSLIQGRADVISVDAVHRVVRLEGRDFSASLVDSLTRESFANQTASEIVTILAARHGLIPRVYPSIDLVGRFFAGGYDQLTLGGYSRLLTEWDLVVQLAQRTGYDAFVNGRTLYFQPRGTDRTTPTNLTLRDVSRLRMDRDLRISGMAMPSAGSWNSQLGSAVFESGMVAGSSEALQASYNLGGELLRPFVTEPNLRPDQLAWLAERYRQDLRQHARVIELEMPAETSLTARSGIVLSNVTPEIDGFYEVESIARSFSAGGGFRQRLRARQGETAAVTATLL